MPDIPCRPRLVPAPRVVGIDASRLAVTDRTGTETYTARLLRHRPPAEPGETTRLYLNAPPGTVPSETIPGDDLVAMPFPRLWTHGRLSWEMARRPPTVLFVPAHVVPIVHPATVVTVHDLGYLVEPAAHPAVDRRRLDWTTRWSARAARRVIVPSGATRRDLVRFYGVPEAEIRVIHHGVGPEFRPVAPSDAVATRARLGLPDRFVLAVGTVQPRKNLNRLAVALRSLAAAGLPHRLVVAGRRGWLADAVEAEIAASGMAERVVRLDYVDPTDLPALYGAAEAFCFPSLYEGFGLPALEAMATGVPTVVANRGALPEVVGGAAILVDPTDPAAIGAALVRVLTDAAERERLVAAGPPRAAGFSWDRASAETFRLLREVADEG